jgi:hypothetical protein
MLRIVSLVALVAAVGAANAVLLPAPAEARPLTSAPAVTGCAGPCMVFVTRYGAGRVTSDPLGIDCGGICRGGYGEGDRVVLTARPASGEVLLGWTGCEQESDPLRCAVTTWGIDCIEVRFSGSGATPIPAECGEVVPVGPPPPPADPTVPLGDHPPLGSPCTLAGSARADVLRGTPGDDVICGRGGNDRIYGSGGHDLILGGNGNDRLYGGVGRDYVVGGAGADVLVGGRDEDELFGRRGADVLRARDGAIDLVHGGPARDRARVDRIIDAVRAVERRF